MAEIQLPPYLVGKELDEQTLSELEVWLSDMAALVNTEQLADGTDLRVAEGNIIRLNTEVTQVAMSITIPYITTQAQFDMVNNERAAGSICITAANTFTYMPTGVMANLTAPAGFIYFNGTQWSA